MTRFLVVLLLSLSLAKCPLGPPPAAAQDTLRMAVFPRKPVMETSRAYTPLVKYLSSRLGKKVELVLFKDFDAFWEGFQKDRYELVHYNQYHYIKSHKELGYRVIMMNEEFGKSLIRAAIIVRKDSGIKSIADLRGKKIVFGGGRQAMQSYIGATQLLRVKGLNPGDYQEDFAVNPPNVIFAVYSGLADAGGTADMLMNLSFVKGRIDVDQLKVLAHGEDLPMLCWAVKPTVDDETARTIQRAMQELTRTEDGRQILKDADATAFVPATDRDFDVVRKVVREALGEEY